MSGLSEVKDWKLAFLASEGCDSQSPPIGGCGGSRVNPKRKVVSYKTHPERERQGERSPAKLAGLLCPNP